MNIRSWIDPGNKITKYLSDEKLIKPSMNHCSKEMNKVEKTCMSGVVEIND